MLEAFVTNLGRYNEGHLDGEYLKLPATTEQVQSLLRRIHVDGVRYEEIFITDYETDIPGLHDALGEHESVDELNYLASLLDELDEGQLALFSAAVEFGEHTNSVTDLINLVQNLDCYELYPGIDDEEDLGRYYIEEMCSMEVPEHLRAYIDYEAYGRDIDLNENGRFVEGGYVVDTGAKFIEFYGERDVPDEYRVFTYPTQEKSIRKALAEYGQMAADAPAARERPKPAQAER